MSPVSTLRQSVQWEPNETRAETFKRTDMSKPKGAFCEYAKTARYKNELQVVYSYRVVTELASEDVS